MSDDSDSDSAIIYSIGIISEILLDDDEENVPKRRRIWIKKWLQNKNEFSNIKLLRELKESEPNDFKNYMRMDDEAFQYLLQKVKPIIIKQDTFMRDAINVETRLSITLRFLATGNSFEDLKFSTPISPESIEQIVIETCIAISKVLKDFIKLPNTSAGWRDVAEKFKHKSGFPHCIGAVDGKHINIRKPPKSGSYYFNYKKTFSVVLMAIVNANSEFLMVDIGTNGRISDGGVFRNTKLFEKFENNELNIPQAEIVYPTEIELTYALVGDDAFALRENLMKPFNSTNLTAQQQVFNKKLSSARVKVENAFGILASRFRVLLTTIALCPEKTTKVVLACCYLHNFLKKRSGVYSEIQAQSGSSQSRNTLMELQASVSRNSSTRAKEMRIKFCEVVNSINVNDE